MFVSIHESYFTTVVKSKEFQIKPFAQSGLVFINDALVVGLGREEAVPLDSFTSDPVKDLSCPPGQAYFHCCYLLQTKLCYPGLTKTKTNAE